MSISKVLSSYLFLIRNLVKITSRNTVLTAYYGYFQSFLLYAVLTWGHSCHTKKLFGLQRKCICIISGLHYRADCLQNFKELRILTLPSIYILQCLLFVKQNLHLYQTCKSRHDYPTRKNENLILDFRRLNRTRNGTRYLGIKFFNALPLTIRNLDVIPFKNKMKKYLITNAFSKFKEYFISVYNSMQ